MAEQNNNLIKGSLLTLSLLGLASLFYHGGSASTRKNPSDADEVSDEDLALEAQAAKRGQYKKPLFTKEELIGQKVRVFYNLHLNTFSVQTKDKTSGTWVVRHYADYVKLGNVEFIISKSGQKRVRKECAKNVHAFVHGELLDLITYPDDFIFHLDASKRAEIYYNPYLTDDWMRIPPPQTDAPKMVPLRVCSGTAKEKEIYVRELPKNSKPIFSAPKGVEMINVVVSEEPVVKVRPQIWEL